MSLDIWVGKVEVRQLPEPDPLVRIVGVGAFTWVSCWAQDEAGFISKVSEVMNSYGLFVFDQEQVMRYDDADENGLVDDELAEQVDDTRANENYCIFGTMHSYISDN